MFLKNLTYLSTFTFLIIFSWVAFGIYNNYTVSKINSGTKILITPIPSSFDLKVVENIKERTIIPVDLSQRSASLSSGVSQASSQPSPAATPVIPPPLSQPSPTPVQSPIIQGVIPSPISATGSANL